MQSLMSREKQPISRLGYKRNQKLKNILRSPKIIFPLISVFKIERLLFLVDRVID